VFSGCNDYGDSNEFLCPRPMEVLFLMIGKLLRSRYSGIFQCEIFQFSKAGALPMVSVPYGLGCGSEGLYHFFRYIQVNALFLLRAAWVGNTRFLFHLGYRFNFVGGINTHILRNPVPTHFRILRPCDGPLLGKGCFGFDPHKLIIKNRIRRGFTFPR